MHRVLWFRIGGKTLHTLKLIGAFLIIGTFLKLAEATYNLFVIVEKVKWAALRPEFIPQLFGWAITAPYAFTTQDVIGVLSGPFADICFWVVGVLVAIMIYKAGNVVFPVEEYGRILEEKKRRLIQHAIRFHEERKKTKKRR